MLGVAVAVWWLLVSAHAGAVRPQNWPICHLSLWWSAASGANHCRDTIWAIEEILGCTEQCTMFIVHLYRPSFQWVNKRVYKFEYPWSADAPCCAISLCDPNLSLVRRLNLSGFSLTCPRQLLCCVAPTKPFRSVTSMTHFQQTNHPPGKPC